MTIVNTEMAAAWNGSEGEHWAEHAERYESIGPAFWEALVARVGIGADDVVLDVGCGTGRSTRDAARITASGRVLGVDLSQRMLERARAAAAAEGLANVRFEQADAQVHPFAEAAFDVAISSFGAMFFAEPVTAFANIARALRQDGRLGLLAWRDLDANEWLSDFRGALAAGRPLPKPPPGLPGPFGLADREQTDAVLRGAGFSDVTIEPFDGPMRMGVDAEDAFAFVSTLGLTRGLLHDLEPEAASDALAALQRTIADHDMPDGVTFGGAAWVITARAPRGPS
jgi:SAM-dependent methyltransferase